MGHHVRSSKKVLKPRVVSKHVEAGGVAAAVEGVSGKIYVGVCVEVDCALGLCAEQNALYNMMTNGEDKFRRVVAVGWDGKVMAPCGVCRELMVQIMGSEYRDIEVLMDYEAGRVEKLGNLTPEWWISTEE